MDRTDSEAIWFGYPLFAGEFVRCQALDRFESSPEVAGINEDSQVLAQLSVMIVVMEAFYGGLFDGPVRRVNWRKANLRRRAAGEDDS